MIKFIKFLIQTFLYKTGIFDLVIRKLKLNYPRDLRIEINKIIPNLQYNKQIEKIDNQYQFLNINIPANNECYIELASEKINYLDKVIEEKISYDIENIEAFYRLSWVIKDLKKNNFKFFSYNIENVLYDLDIKYKNLFYSAYTISDRLENIALFCTLTGTVLSKKNIKFINKDIKILLNNLEYNVYGYNNHLFKNFKALYICGLFITNTNLKNTFKKYIINYFDIFVDNDSLLNEGSSHYIILFYKWCVELLFFSKIYSDLKMYNFIKNKINKMNQSLGIFYIKNYNNFVKFGDISPDYNFNFIKSYVSFILEFLKENELLLNFKNVKLNIDKNFWIRKDIGNSIIISRKINLNKIHYHEHSDFFHFVYFYKNQSIFIDSGNKNYIEDSNRKKYKSLKSHNSIIIDKIIYRNMWNTFFNNLSNYSTFSNQHNVSFIYKSQYSTINRIISILNQGITITDTINNEYLSKYIETVFQLNPRLKILQKAENKYLLEVNEMNFDFSIETDVKFKTKINKNFYASDYGLECEKEFLSIVFEKVKKLKVQYILKEK